MCKKLMHGEKLQREPLQVFRQALPTGGPREQRSAISWAMVLTAADVTVLIRVKATCPATCYTRSIRAPFPMPREGPIDAHQAQPRQRGQRPSCGAKPIVTDHQTLRFAVAAFDDPMELKRALHTLSARGKTLDDVSYVGLDRVLTDKTAEIERSFRTLCFPGNVHPIACTAGPVADRLAGQLQVGAATLDAALGRWLIARHAAHLQRAVEEGKILLWVQLFDNDDEKRAYLSLLATSANTVGVHDLVGA
jgi:hypothetical protein